MAGPSSVCKHLFYCPCKLPYKRRPGLVFAVQSFPCGRFQERALAPIFPGSYAYLSLKDTTEKNFRSVSIDDATSENDAPFERIMSPARCIRHCVRYSRGVWPKTVLNSRQTQTSTCVLRAQVTQPTSSYQGPNALPVSLYLDAYRTRPPTTPLAEPPSCLRKPNRVDKQCFIKDN